MCTDRLDVVCVEKKNEKLENRTEGSSSSDGHSHYCKRRELQCFIALIENIVVGEENLPLPCGPSS